MKFRDKSLAPFRKFYGYLKKDTVLFYKRRKYLYTFLLLPLVIASLFLFALNSSDYTLNVGVCDLDGTSISREAFGSLNGFETTIFDSTNCEQELISGVESGAYDLGFVVPVGFKNNLENLKQSKMVVYYDNTDVAFSNLISWKVDQAMEPFERRVIDELNSEVKRNVRSIRDGFDLISPQLKGVSPRLGDKLEDMDESLNNLEEMDTEYLVNPIWTDKRGVYEVDSKSAGLAFIFPVLALFVILMLASTSIIYDRKSNFLIRVKSSSSVFSYLLAKLVFFFALVLIQFLIILGLFYLYGGGYSFSVLSVLKLIFYVAFVDALIGFLIGMISENEGIAVLLSLVVSFPLMLVSGLFFPIQTLPRIIQFVAKILPLQFQIDAAKNVLLFKGSMSNVWAYGVVGLFVAVWWLVKRKG